MKHLNFELYERALFNNETIRCTQQRFKSDYHKIYMQSVHKIGLKEFNHLMRLLNIQQEWILILLINQNKRKDKDLYNFTIKNK